MNKENVLRITGVVLFVAANALLTMTDAPVEQKYRILSELCEKYLLSHNSWDAPPMNCETELTYLQRRIKKTLQELKDARDNSDISMDEDDRATEDSNSRAEP